MSEIKILIQTTRTLGLSQVARIIEELKTLTPSEQSAVIANLLAIVKIAELHLYKPQLTATERMAAKYG